MQTTTSFPAAVVAKSLVINALHFAQQQSISVIPAHFLALAKADAEWLPFAEYAAVLEWLEMEVGGNVGLQLSQQANLMALGIVGQLVQYSRHLQEALEQACKAFNLLGNVLQLHLKVQEDAVQLLVEADQASQVAFPKATAQFVLMVLQFAYQEISWLTFQKAALKQAELVAVYSDFASIEASWNCPIRVGQAHNCIHLSADYLALPIVSADYGLLLQLEQIACQRLKTISPTVATYTQKVERLLYALQTPKLPSLSEVARQLHCSTRALQRFLQAEGSSFKHITTTVQQQMALAYLKQESSIQEIASLLNYASSSAFVHAFKRWFGQSPQQYRSVHFKT